MGHLRDEDVERLIAHLAAERASGRTPDHVAAPRPSLQARAGAAGGGPRRTRLWLALITGITAAVVVLVLYQSRKTNGSHEVVLTQELKSLWERATSDEAWRELDDVLMGLTSTPERLLAPRGKVVGPTVEFSFELPEIAEGSWSLVLSIHADDPAKTPNPPLVHIDYRGGHQKALTRAVSGLEPSRYTWTVRFDSEKHPGFEEVFHPAEAQFTVVRREELDEVTIKVVDTGSAEGDALVRARELEEQGYWIDARRMLESLEVSNDPRLEAMRLYVLAATLAKLGDTEGVKERENEFRRLRAKPTGSGYDHE